MIQRNFGHNVPKINWIRVITKKDTWANEYFMTVLYPATNTSYLIVQPSLDNIEGKVDSEFNAYADG